MTCKPCLAIATLAAIAGTIAFAQPTKESKPALKPSNQPAAPAGQPADMQLPPGMTADDMQACMAAATPGEQHAWLAQDVGTWNGKCKMWMTPEAEVLTSEFTTTITPFLDGRYIQCETSGEMPGMGPFTGYGLTGFDNVSQKFQRTWVDNCGTGMMNGTGERSSDGSTLNLKFTYNCPLHKDGPVTYRQVEKRTGKDTMTLEMFGPEPHSNKEYKVMEISYTRSHGAVGSAH